MTISANFGQKARKQISPHLATLIYIDHALPHSPTSMKLRGLCAKNSERREARAELKLYKKHESY